MRVTVIRIATDWTHTCIANCGTCNFVTISLQVLQYSLQVQLQQELVNENTMKEQNTRKYVSMTELDVLLQCFSPIRQLYIFVGKYILKNARLPKLVKFILILDCMLKFTKRLFIISVLFHHTLQGSLQEEGETSSQVTK